MYDTNYLNRFLVQNALKDRLALPMINKIKEIIKMNAVWLKVQEQFK